jgi:hypothetical protein
MKVKKKQFESLWKMWTDIAKFPASVYDVNARLFPASLDGRFPILKETIGEDEIQYGLYATIAGRTLLVNRGIEMTLIKTQPVITDSPYALERGAPIRVRETSEKVIQMARQNDEVANALITYDSCRLSFYFDKPLEILAYEEQLDSALRPKWEILLLRDRSEGRFGHLNDSFIRGFMRYVKDAKKAS